MGTPTPRVSLACVTDFINRDGWLRTSLRLRVARPVLGGPFLDREGRPRRRRDAADTPMAGLEPALRWLGGQAAGPTNTMALAEAGRSLARPIRTQVH